MIVCKFTCNRCDADSVPFRVRGRASEEDPIRWIKDVVGAAMGEAHRRHSPHCTGDKADLMLPMPKDAGWIGQDLEAAQ